MDNREFINVKVVEAFKEYIAKYEQGEVINLTLIIDNCELVLKPLGLNEGKKFNIVNAG